MKLNFFQAYQYFLQSLSELSKSEIASDAFFDSGFTLRLPKDESSAQLEDVREELLQICEGQLIEEIEDSLISTMAQNQCEL